MKLSLERQRLLMVYLLMGWCLLLTGYRMYRSEDWLALGLMWNMFLAAVPLFWSASVRWAEKRGSRPLCGMFFFLWLIFFPNAPYLLTDMIHLGSRVNDWYVLAMLLSCAGTGTLLGYLSLMEVQAVIERRLGAGWGWAVACGSMMLSAFGIYVGRYLRWNSWNAITSPGAVLHDVVQQFIDPGPYPHPAEVTLVFGAGLILGYLALRVFGVRAERQ